MQRQLGNSLDVSRLRALVPAAEQNHERLAPRDDVDSQPRPPVDSWLRHPETPRPTGRTSPGLPSDKRRRRTRTLERARTSSRFANQLANATVSRTSITRHRIPKDTHRQDALSRKSAGARAIHPCPLRTDSTAGILRKSIQLGDTLRARACRAFATRPRPPTPPPPSPPGRNPPASPAAAATRTESAGPPNATRSPPDREVCTAPYPTWRAAAGARIAGCSNRSPDGGCTAAPSPRPAKSWTAAPRAPARARSHSPYKAWEGITEAAAALKS